MYKINCSGLGNLFVRSRGKVNIHITQLWWNHATVTTNKIQPHGSEKNNFIVKIQKGHTSFLVRLFDLISCQIDRFILDQLAYKPFVWIDAVSLLLNIIESLVVRESIGFHEIRDHKWCTAWWESYVTFILYVVSLTQPELTLSNFS